MKPPDRDNRTTLHPGRVDLPLARRSKEEVASEKKKKQRKAKAQQKAKESAMDLLAGIESQSLAAAIKQPRKRPAESDVEVSLLSLIR